MINIKMKNIVTMLFSGMALVEVSESLKEKVHFGKWLQNNDDGTSNVRTFEWMVKVSIKECVDACKSTKACEYINFEVRSRKCALMRKSEINDTHDENVEIKPGYIFGNKSEWDLNEFTECDNCRSYGKCHIDGWLEGNNSICRNSVSTHRRIHTVADYEKNVAEWSQRPWVSDECIDYVVSASIVQQSRRFILGGNENWKYSCSCINTCCRIPRIDGLHGNIFSYGSRIRIGCADGYEVFPEIGTCSENGNWVGDQSQMRRWLFFKGYFYILQPLHMGWFQAKSHCENMCGHLVDINDEQEQQFLEGWLNDWNEPNKWTGGNDLANEGEFVWSDGSLVSEYTNWHIGHPNNHNGNQDCIALFGPRKNHSWNDLNCDQEFQSVCEIH